MEQNGNVRLGRRGSRGHRGVLPLQRTPSQRATTRNEVPRIRNGGRHCCQPPSAPSEGSAGVRQLLKPEGPLLLDPGSPAQASLPVVNPNPKTGSISFRGPSWTNPLSRRLHPEGHRVRARKTGSSGASAGWSNSKPKLLLIACRWRSDLPSPPHPSCRCRRSGEAGTSVPITHSLWASSRVAQRGNCTTGPVDIGDIAHKCRDCASRAAGGSPMRPVHIPSLRWSNFRVARPIWLSPTPRPV